MRQNRGFDASASRWRWSLGRKCCAPEVPALLSGVRVTGAHPGHGPRRAVPPGVVRQARQAATPRAGASPSPWSAATRRVDEHACGLLQLLHSTPPRVLYSAYWYRSGTNNTMRTHLGEIAAEAAGLVAESDTRTCSTSAATTAPCSGPIPTRTRRVGIDPSDIATETADDNFTIVQDLFPSAELAGIAEGDLFDIVTSIAMFYDVEDPVQFVSDVKNLLAADGRVDLRGRVHADDARAERVRHDLSRAPRVLLAQRARVHPGATRACACSAPR